MVGSKNLVITRGTTMKALHFALVGTAALALAACNNNKEQDTLGDNIEENYQQTDQLNDLAADAANQVDEADTLGNQAAQLNNSAPEDSNTVDNAVDPANEEAVQGM
jgi:ABC-type oligopeptide transport system substrate-binding subunit